MKRTLFVIVASLLLAFVISSCEDTPAISDIVEYSTPTIKGTITISDGSDVKPEEVYVKVIDSDDKTVTIQKASSDGTFVIQNLSQDMTYKILFTSEEPEFNNRSVTRGKGSGVGGWLKDVVPAVKEGNNVGSVKMKPLGTIKGRVTVDGKAEHYDTTVYIPGTSYSAITDKDGNFSIYSVPEGTYTLRYTHEDCVAYMMQNVMLVCPDDVENPKKTVGNVVLRSSRGTVQGKAVLGDADDSTGITIKLESEDKSTSYDSSTSSNGNYTINDVTPGRYRVIASYSTYLSQSTGYFDVSAATVTSVPERLELLGDYGTIKGYASLSDSEKKEGIQILISTTDGTNSYSVLTDNDGSFTKIVKPGQYSITASSPDYTSQTKTLTVVQDKTVEAPFSPLLSVYGKLSGMTVTSGEFVSLLDSSGTTVRTVQSSSGCTFSFTRLEPGTYSLSISKDGYFSATVSDVIVVEGEDNSITTPELISTNGTVSGFVTLEGSSDNSGVAVTFTDSSDSDNVYSAVSAADGSFRITGIKKTSNYLLTYSKDGYVSNLSNSVDVTVGKVVTADSVTLKSVMSTISGKIQLDGALTHENITILLKNETNQYNATTDQKGDYKINRVLPGTYTLMASKDGYVTAATDEFVIGASSDVEVELLTLSVAIRSITGSVELELLDDYAGALVTATNLADSTDVYSAITNSAGDYTLAGMTPGEYSIVISYNGYRTATLPTVNVVSSTVTTIPLTEMKINRGTITGVAKLEGRSSSEAITVELLRGSDVYALTYTDNSGSYSFYVPQGNYTGVRYSKTDFASSSVSKDIALFADNYFSMGNETLKATHNSVYGTVDVLTTDDESAVTISFDGVTTIDSYTTTADGSFRFEHVPVGKYTLRFQRQDCSDITIPVEVKAADGINLGTVEITPNTATIKGKVNLENGTSLSGVKVSVDLGTKVLETTTDDSGRYEIGGVSIADEYRVTYSKDGWDNKTQQITPKLNILEVRELDEITLVDTTAPVLSSVVINSGANTTSKKNITLNLTASDSGSGLEKIMVTYDDVFDKTVRRYDYSSIFEWELPAENGLKTVYVRVVDRAGNESASFTASVTLTNQKTEVSGVLSGDNLIWTKDKSPYLVTGPVMVESGKTLTIESGVDVQISGNYYIQVEGTLLASGTDDEWVKIYGIYDGTDNWQGIKVINDNGTKIAYTEITGLTQGIQGTCEIDNSIIMASEGGYALGYRVYEEWGSSDDKYFTGLISNSVLDGKLNAMCSFIKNSAFNSEKIYLTVTGEVFNTDFSGIISGTMIGSFVQNTFKGTGELIFSSSSLMNDQIEMSSLVVKESSMVRYTTINNSALSIECGYWNKNVINNCTFNSFSAYRFTMSNIVGCGTLTVSTQRLNREAYDMTGNYWGDDKTAELDGKASTDKISFLYHYANDFNLSRVDWENYSKTILTDCGYQGENFNNQGTSSGYFIGDTGPAGGLIFYDKGYYSDGWRYLESGLEDLFYKDEYGNNCFYPFGFYRPNGSTDMVVGTSSGIGTGKENTEALVSAMGETTYIYSNDTTWADPSEKGLYAAKACADYCITVDGVEYDDWFLPSFDELYLMYSVLHKRGLGNFNVNSHYYSSSEQDNEFVRSMYFSRDDQGYGVGRAGGGVITRPIRAF